MHWVLHFDINIIKNIGHDVFCKHCIVKPRKQCFEIMSKSCIIEIWKNKAL